MDSVAVVNIVAEGPSQEISRARGWLMALSAISYSVEQEGHMYKNHDKLAKPARGKTFPVSIADAVKLPGVFGFPVPSGYKRITVSLENPDGRSDHGKKVAALYPSELLTIYSVLDDDDTGMAKLALNEALRLFAGLSKEVTVLDRRRISISYCAYWSGKNKLVITKRVRRATSVKYRGDAKFSHAFKPKGIETDEQVVSSLELSAPTT